MVSGNRGSPEEAEKGLRGWNRGKGKRFQARMGKALKKTRGREARCSDTSCSLLRILLGPPCCVSDFTACGFSVLPSEFLKETRDF